MVKKVFVLFVGFVFFTSLVQAQVTHSAGYDLDLGAVGDNKTFEGMLQVLNTSSATTIEDFLAGWKEKDPLIFRYYLLTYRSRSLQEASFEYPRVILYHPVGEFAATFNGHATQKGYQQIELFCFNYQKNNFEFYEISFGENQKPTLSEPNPQKCLDCHQALGRSSPDPRPNWEPYNLWPGFYGSVEGVFKSKSSALSQTQQAKIRPETDSYLLDEIPQEKERYTRFMNEVRPHHPRYRFLEPFSKDQAREDVRSYGTHVLSELKTLMFTQRVSQLNFLRVARLMQEDPEIFDYLKEALVALLHCSSSQLPAAFSNWALENSSLKGKSFTSAGSLNLGDQIRFLFEPFYFNTDDWSMDFKTDGRFASSNRFGTPGRPHLELLLAINTLSPSVAKLTNGRRCSGPEFVQSLAKYNDLQTAIKLQEKRVSFKERIEKLKNMPLVNRCIGCHVDPSSQDLPMIPFDQPLELKKRLSQAGYKRGTLLEEIIYRTGAHVSSDEQMPPRGIPTEKQREDLISYLKSL